MRIKTDIKANYKAVFNNGKTVRLRLDPSLPISTPQYAEIEDVAINNKCAANCFIAGTKVLTNKGLVNIEDIIVGNTVISYSIDRKVMEDKLVYELFVSKYLGELIEITLLNDRVITCTPNHKIYTINRGYVIAGELQLNDIIKGFLEKPIKDINMISDFEGNVYNFSVEDNHNYMVEGIVVSNCHYCYTNALKSGSNFTNIVDKAIEVWDKPLNDKVIQIAIGGAGESTLHPDWIEFVKTVNQLDITPNYTTNGMHLSDDILAATEQYCGGVAVSYHPHIDKVFHTAIDKLSSIKTQLNTHLIIGSEKSLIDAQSLFDLYQDDIKYFVMLPYQAAGRASHIEVNNTWRLMFEWISSLDKASRNKFAFGALFYDWLLLNKIDLKIDVYEPEIYSGYRIMDDSFKTLRKSSYNLEEK